jgi:hypothetical protein
MTAAKRMERGTMIAALVLFDTDGALSLEAATERFNTTAPNYRGLTGLHAKAYLHAEDSSQVGGFYLWESRAAADAMYTAAWRAKVTEVYGVPPTVRYFDVPVLIENGGNR